MIRNGTQCLFLSLALGLAGACTRGSGDEEMVEVVEAEEGPAPEAEQNITAEENYIPQEFVEEVAPEGQAPELEPKEVMPVVQEEILEAGPTKKTPVVGDSFEYVVVRGDTLSKIAQRVYGDKYRWKEIAEINPNVKNPNLIFPGDMIQIKTIDTKGKEFASAYGAMRESTSKTISVESGDTLSSIAQKNLGTQENWRVVWSLNKSTLRSPHKLRAGMKLKLSTGMPAFRPYRAATVRKSS